MPIPVIDLAKLPKRYVPVALACLDQSESNFGYVVLFEKPLLQCGDKDRELLADALEKFCERLRNFGKTPNRLQ